MLVSTVLPRPVLAGWDYKEQYGFWSKTPFRRVAIEDCNRFHPSDTHIDRGTWRGISTNAKLGPLV